MSLEAEPPLRICNDLYKILNNKISRKGMLKYDEEPGIWVWFVLGSIWRCHIKVCGSCSQQETVLTAPVEKKTLFLKKLELCPHFCFHYKGSRIYIGRLTIELDIHTTSCLSGSIVFKPEKSTGNSFLSRRTSDW